MKLSLPRFSAITITLACALVGSRSLTACSSDETKTPAGSTPAGEQKTTKISAAAGGTVSDPSGTATLTIPPGALAVDTDITLAVNPANGQVLGSVYDFGPDGTTFKTPATLSIKATGIVVADATLAIGIGSNNAFTKLEGSTRSGDTVTAPVAHFTDFALIAVGGLTPAPPPDSGTPTDSGGPVTGGDCAFKGSYELASYFCGTQDITSAWKQVIPSDAVVITDRPGGGCILTLTHKSSTCTEGETYEITVTSGSTYNVDQKGITSCAPDACKFSANDKACVVGDRVKTETGTFTSEGAGKFRYRRTTGADDVCGGQESNVLFGPPVK